MAHRETCQNALAETEKNWKDFQDKFDKVQETLVNNIARSLGKPPPVGKKRLGAVQEEEDGSGNDSVGKADTEEDIPAHKRAMTTGVAEKDVPAYKRLRPDEKCAVGDWKHSPPSLVAVGAHKILEDGFHTLASRS